MARGRLALHGAIVATLAFAGCSDGGSGSTPAHAGFDAAAAFRILRGQVSIGPRPSGSRAARSDAAAIAADLRRAGARQVGVQRPEHNVVARIPGGEPGSVVVGAHYDTKALRGFVGANDGASGVAVVLELARELAPRVTGQSIRFVLFDGEESRGRSDGARAFARSGDRGSSQYVAYARRGGLQGSPPIDSISAMVLFDMVGDCHLEIPREATSDPALYERFREAASGTRDDPFGGESGGILDDHTPFERAGIPAVDLIDFDYGPGPPPGAWWHTRRDDLAHVCPASLGAVGRSAAAVLADFQPPG